MTFVTKMRLQSGDRTTLDSVVSEIKSTVGRKGAEMKGPHSSPPEKIRVAQYKGLSDERAGRFSPWKYTVYTRDLEIVGGNSAVRLVTQEMDFPTSLHVEVEVEQKRPMGHTA